MSTELVTVMAAAERREPQAAAVRPRADFLAHLIATSAQAPQTRQRRRAEPSEVVSAYDAVGAVGQWPTRSGRTLSRSL